MAKIEFCQKSIKGNETRHAMNFRLESGLVYMDQTLNHIIIEIRFISDSIWVNMGLDFYVDYKLSL